MADINGTSGADSLVGTGDADVILGFEGADFILAGAGDDRAEGGTGNDRIFGEDGHDQLFGDDGDDEIGGGAGDDFIAGAIGADYLYGGLGADHIQGGDDNDTLFGEDGNDLIGGGSGTDYIDGGVGLDYMYGEAGNDSIFGGGDNDTLFGQDGDDTIGGGSGHDYIEGNAGLDFLYGETGNDTILGGGDNDQLFGQDGDDSIGGDAGDDYIEGGNGLDFLYGGIGADFVVGGAEIDQLFGQDGDDIIGGDDGDDYVEGGIGLDYLFLGAGADFAVGGADADSLYGEGGNDLLFGESGNDVIGSGDGDDYVEGGADADYIYGETGGDTILGGAASDLLFGQDGNDLVGGDEGNDYIEGNVGLDFLHGGIGNDTIIGGADADQMFGQDGNDTIGGDGGNDYVEGGAGADFIYGVDGNDTLLGGGDADQLFGQDGDDTIGGDDGNDYAEGAAGADFIYTGTGDDTVFGGIGNDQLFGQDDNDLLGGDEGDDSIDGGAGNDTLLGGAGNDNLTGGAGNDSFAILNALGAGNVDSIGDFAAGADRILLGGDAGLPFAILASGNLRAETFVIGAAAVAADDYLIYNSTTGALLYDADGSGAGAAVQFATLTPGLALTAADFFVLGPTNTPTVVTSGGTASIAENTAASTVVYTATATDADGDRITYSLSGTDAALLSIDAVTGQVRLNNPADFETKNSYSFNVVASDSGSSTARGVVLTITDVSDGASTPIINEQAGPNNNRNLAQAIDRGGFLVANNPNLHNDDLPSATIVGSVSDSADIDFFSITLQAGELLILDVDGTNGLDSHLRLYAANGNEIGDNDDLIVDDPGSDPPFGHNTDSQIRFRAATGGTYYFSIESFQESSGTPSSGAYQINVSIGPPATSAQIAQEDVEALISGLEWPTTNITYAFPNEVNDYTQPFGDPQDPELASFSPFTGTQQAAVQLMLAHISSLTQLTFTRLFDDGEIDAKLRYAMTDATGAAHAYLPGNSDEAGSAWFNKTDFNAPAKGNYAWMGILHETGHALGLKHGHEFPVAISGGRDSVEYSVMTYRSFPGQDLSNGGGYTNEDWGYPQTLMMYDIAALQQIYGANYNTNPTNSVYSWNPTTGEMSINGTPQGAPGNGDGVTQAGENRILMTIWDGGGVDTYDLSAYSGGTIIDLRPGEWTTTSSVQLANLRDSAGGPHFARGNIANALLFEGNTASLIENAIGSGGADTFFANQALNLLTGGGGADTFRWASSSDAGTGGFADVIADLLRGTDLIHLSDIDANTGTGANDAFAFIGTSAFHSVAGELRYQVEGGNARIQADLDGNGLADLEIIVNNNTILAGTDFIL